VGLQTQSIAVDVSTLVVDMRISINMASLTLEQVVSKPMKIIQQMGQNIVAELRSQSQAIESWRASQAIESWRALSPGAVNARLQFAADIMRQIAARDLVWFSRNENFKDAVAEMLQIKEALTNESALRFHKLELSKLTLQSLPASTSGLSDLVELSLPNCEQLTSLPDLTGLTSLTKLGLFRCKALETLPASLNCLTQLKDIRLDQVDNLLCLPDLSGLPDLKFSTGFSAPHLTKWHKDGCTAFNGFDHVWSFGDGTGSSESRVPKLANGTILCVLAEGAPQDKQDAAQASLAELAHGSGGPVLFALATSTVIYSKKWHVTNGEGIMSGRPFSAEDGALVVRAASGLGPPDGSIQLVVFDSKHGVAHTSPPGVVSSIADFYTSFSAGSLDRTPLLQGKALEDAIYQIMPLKQMTEEEAREWLAGKDAQYEAKQLKNMEDMYAGVKKQVRLMREGMTLEEASKKVNAGMNSDSSSEDELSNIHQLSNELGRHSAALT
jgi:hypothetical protein